MYGLETIALSHTQNTDTPSVFETRKQRCPELSLSLPLFSLCQGWSSARNFFTAWSDRLFHPTLYLVFFFQSSSCRAFFTSLLPQSAHLSLDLPRLLLPPWRYSAAHFGSFFPSSSMSNYSRWWPMCSTSVFSRLVFSLFLVNSPFHSSSVSCSSCLPFAPGTCRPHRGVSS